MTDSSDAFCLNCLVWVYKSENIEAFCSCPCNLMCLSLVEFNLLPHKKHKNNEVKHSVVLSPSSLFLSHPTRYTSYFSCLLPVCMSYVLSHFLTVKLPCIQTMYWHACVCCGIAPPASRAGRSIIKTVQWRVPCRPDISTLCMESVIAASSLRSPCERRTPLSCDVNGRKIRNWNASLQWRRSCDSCSVRASPVLF